MRRCKIRIYIAHTYGRRHGLSSKECEANVFKSIEYGRALIKKGHTPFLPNLFHYVHSGWDSSPDEDIWLSMTVEWLRQCDALLVAEVPPWPDSGVHREIDVATEMNIPIYWSLGEV